MLVSSIDISKKKMSMDLGYSRGLIPRSPSAPTRQLGDPAAFHGPKLTLVVEAI